MALKQLLNVRLVTRLAVFLVVMMGVGMGVMGLLVRWVQSTEGLVIGSLIALVAFFPIGVWLVKWAMQPVLEIQSVAEHVLKGWGGVTADSDELTTLKNTLTSLASRSQERIQALESERTKVAAILDSMVEGVIALDTHGRVMLMNPAASHILDVEHVSAEGQSLLEVIRNRGLADLVEWCRTLASNEQCRQEIELHLPVHRVLEVNAMPLPVTPTTRGIVLVFHDITELRRLERVRAEFVANVSHELRTPLTAIRGYLETLLDDAAPEPQTQRRFLGVAHTHAERLGRLIDDLLSLSDIETGKVVLRPRTIVLTELIGEVSAIFEKDASKKGVTFFNQVPPHLGVHADPDRLSQILVNLIDNAVKHTPAGGAITFNAVALHDEKIGIRVQDTGHGIPPGDLPRITERFYRVDKARSREEGGTGLGLAIVKHLVHLHGGVLRIDSELGKGTTIEVVLPAAHLTPTL